MKKIILSLATVAMVSLFSHSARAEVLWNAIAINSWGWGMATNVSGNTNVSGEEAARSKAIDSCESRTARTCSDMTVSVPTNWYLVGIYCWGNVPSTGGSFYSYQTAVEVAANKVGAKPYNCRIDVQQ
jgi:hypothetical protein